MNVLERRQALGEADAIAAGRASLRSSVAMVLAVTLLLVLAPAALAQEVPDPGPPSGGGGVDLGPLLGRLGGLADAFGGLREWLGDRWADFLGVVTWTLGMA